MGLIRSYEWCSSQVNKTITYTKEFIINVEIIDVVFLYSLPKFLISVAANLNLTINSLVDCF